MISSTKILRRCVLLMLVLGAETMQAQNNAKTDQSLNAQQRRIVGISALTAVGDLKPLKSQLNAALDSGLSINEIKEVLVLLYAYCGFPRSLNAIGAFMQVLEDRRSNGINDKAGKDFSASTNPIGKYEQGGKTLEALTKTPQIKPAPGFGEFAPRIDAFLKEHLFADIFESDVLSYQQRELATISALSAMRGVEAQLKSHLTMGKNTGITDHQLLHIADLIERHVDRTQANILREMLSKPVSQVISPEMMVRISEIEIVPEHLEEYKMILNGEAAASVKLEPGVIAIFPMYQKENATQIRIVEIYADKSAYQSHLYSHHFQHYKTSTLKMVKSLKLVDMGSLDPEMMQQIFKKLK